MTTNTTQPPSLAAKHNAATPTLDPSVESRLRRVADGARRYVLIESLGWVLGFAGLAMGIQFLLDFGTRGLDWSMRATLTSLIAATMAWQFWRRAVSPLRHSFGSAEIAKLVERHYPQLRSELISAVRFSSGEVGPAEVNSPNLMTAAVADAGRRAKTLDFSVVLDPRRARWSGAVIATVILAGITAATTAPDITSLWFARNILLQNVDWPKRTHLVVEREGDELIGARGDDFVVQASATGVQPRTVDIIYETASGQRGRDVMVTVGSRGAYRYRHTFPNVDEDFEFYLEGGDDRTEPLHARVLERPRVAQTSMRINPPAYTHLEPAQLGDGQRAAQILPGSDVTIRAQMNKPVRNAILMAGRDVVAEGIRDANQWTANFAPMETHTYHFDLIDEVGLANKRPVRFSLRVAPDEPPRARMKLVGVGSMITPEAVLPIELDFADTYGLATAELNYEISREGSSLSTIPLPSFTPSAPTFATSRFWPVSSESVVPGETLTLQASATDFNTVTGPGVAISPEFTLRVVTRDEFLAELARREQEYRMDFERLIDAQEQLRSSLLTVLGREGTDRNRDQLAAQLAPLERRQRNIAGSVNVIRQQFEMIYAELRVNQLDSKDEQERLGDRIVQPLTQLAKRDLVLGADIIRHWSREGTAEKASQVDPQQAEILTQMRTVLENMIEWEGYQEVVSMLRDIIRLQQELRRETQGTLQDQGHDVFDD